jgi:hypothetical protein
VKLPLVLALVVATASAAPVQQRAEVTRDLWISSHASEREGNNGGSPKLKLKGIQEFFLIDFDPAPFRGKRVVRAQLHVHLEGTETLGRTTVSTVADAWVEGRGTNYAKIVGASCFSWARTNERRWAEGESDITGVILGTGGSRWGFGDPSSRDPAGWQVIPIEPAVVQARLDGISHGFCVMDDVGSEYTRDGNTLHYRSFPNRYVASREGPRHTAPYFTLWCEEDGAPVSPQPPAALASTTRAERRAVLPPIVTPATAPAPGVSWRDEFGEPLASLEFFAARNEAIGFSTESVPDKVSIDLTVSRFAMPTVAGHTDPLVPADDGRFIEIYVPRNAKAGRHAGTLRIDGRDVPFAVTVWNFMLPDRLSFIPQMNSYALPDHARDYYRLAHEHRTTLNRLPYGWTGKVSAAPRIRGDGSWDWTAWDAEFGPLLDGSAFRDLPRGAVPVDAFYLPLNENWPMDHEKHFRGGYWIESAYDADYWKEFRAAAEQFAAHISAQGWTEPMFEFYLNNKIYFKRDRGNRWDACSAPWIFDEPMNTQDFWALRHFGLEFGRGVAAHPAARMTFRADISRPEWQRDLLDGITNVEVVSGVLRTYRDRVISRSSRDGNLVYMYGAANRIGTSNVMPAAWCVESWALGADGVVPWQTIGKPAAWNTPDDLSLFYPTPNGPVPSLRLKSFRAGQQVVEYLTLFARLSGQSRTSIGAAILEAPGLRGQVQKKSEADAGASLFGPDAPRSLRELRHRIGTWLDAQAPAPRERWHDPRPKRFDPAHVREISPLPAPAGQ